MGRSNYARFATQCIVNWLAIDTDADDGLNRHARSEARAVAVADGSDSVAAKGLHDWFTQRLTIDPGVPAPFTDLGYNLLSTTLDLVNWLALVRWIRYGEGEAEPDYRQDDDEDISDIEDLNIDP